MDIIGVIFNLSGTMICDRELHAEAWRLCIEDLIMRDISNNDVRIYIEGKDSRGILEHFLGTGLSETMILQFQEEKDRIYRNMVIDEHPRPVPGLTGFLDYLSKASIPMAIVTTQPVRNVNLLFDEYELFRWFDWDHVIMMSDGIVRTPHRMLYTQAAKQLQVTPGHCLCFASLPDEIKSAYDAGILNITLLTDRPLTSEEEKLPGVIKTIRDFTDLKM